MNFDTIVFVKKQWSCIFCLTLPTEEHNYASQTVDNDVRLDPQERSKREFVRRRLVVFYVLVSERSRGQQVYSARSTRKGTTLVS